MGNLWSNVSEAFVIMIIGMTNVFLMLTIAMFGMMLIGYFASPERQKRKTASSIESSVEQGEIVSGEEDFSEDEELALAATVAVAHHNAQKAKNIGLIIRKDLEV